MAGVVGVVCVVGLRPEPHDLGRELAQRYPESVPSQTTRTLGKIVLGWDFAHVAASIPLSDQLSPPERAKTQGFNDLVLNRASAASQVGNRRVVYASDGFGIMNLNRRRSPDPPDRWPLWWQFLAGQRQGR